MEEYYEINDNKKNSTFMVVNCLDKEKKRDFDETIFEKHH
jgi:hypothetical protein